MTTLPLLQEGGQGAAQSVPDLSASNDMNDSEELFSAERPMSVEQARADVAARMKEAAAMTTAAGGGGGGSPYGGGRLSINNRKGGGLNGSLGKKRTSQNGRLVSSNSTVR